MKSALFKEIVSEHINNLKGFLRKYPSNSSVKNVKMGIKQLKALL